MGGNVSFSRAMLLACRPGCHPGVGRDVKWAGISNLAGLLAGIPGYHYGVSGVSIEEAGQGKFFH